MKSKDARELLFKLFLFMTPLWVLIAIYIIMDPFKVIYHYSSYYPTKGIQVIVLNADYIATQTLLNNYENGNYNSYIFGNSRSCQYRIAEWEKYIGPQNCFHFSASDESIYGIEKKVWLLDSLGCKMDNALVVLDYKTLYQTVNSGGHLFIKHPVLSGQSWYSFEMEFFKAFYNPRYVRSFFDYAISGQYKEFMSEVMVHTPIYYTSIENEFIPYWADSMIENNPENFYSLNKTNFFKRPEKEQTSPIVILEQQKIFLKNIEAIFAKHKTQCRIIINPLYDQIKLNGTDLAYLRFIFGSNNVFDFSGINRMTEDYHNYYETSHYRWPIAAQILDSVYTMSPIMAEKKSAADSKKNKSHPNIFTWLSNNYISDFL